MLRHGWIAVALSLSCGDNLSDRSSFAYPLDDLLTVRDLQAKGTHNSYHVATEPAATPDWNYTHEPLHLQAAVGVRQFELDININLAMERFEVFHFFRADEGTTCRLLRDCFRDIEKWSDGSPAHHPIAIMLEIKDGFSDEYVQPFFEILENEISGAFSPDDLITPDMVRGDSPSLRDAVAASGWPTLGATRGRIFFFLLASDEFRDYYTYGDTSLDGRLAFVRAGPDKPYAAVASHDDPIGSADAIREALDAGLLVRTRTDVVTEDGPRLDPDRAEAALASGAHFLSTDEPLTDFIGGTPSRCNPVLAPAECTDLAIEDPAFVE